MKIEIAEKNALAIEAALAAVNGRARSHTVTSYDEVSSLVRKLMKGVDGLTLADRAGARASYVPAGPWAKAYEYAAISTWISLQIAADGKRVFLVDVAPVSVRPKSAERLDVTLTATGYDSYVERCKARFSRAEPVAETPAAIARREAALDRLERDEAILAQLAA